MRRLLALMLTLITITGCTKSNIKKDFPNNKVRFQEFKTVYSGEITTLNYLKTVNANEFGLISNFVDNLIEYDKYGIPTPSLAVEWNYSEDKTIWTIKLRQGVKWYTHQGKEYGEVTAEDFVEGAKYILDSNKESGTANILYSVIKNGKAYYEGKIDDFSKVGVRALDDYTLEYTLVRGTPYFLSMLNYVCFLPINRKFLEEKGELFGTDNKNILYNGAYIMKVFEPQGRRILIKNKNYWDKDNVFIDRIKQVYNQESASLAPELFIRKEVDYANIPASMVEQWMNDPVKRDLIRPNRTGFYTYFYGLNFKPVYDDVYEPDNWKVAVNNESFRKSLFHGLDRISAMTTLEPYDPKQRLLNTVTPRGFLSIEGIDYTEISDLKKFTNNEPFNKDLAKEFRDKAMEELKGRVKFPVIVYMPYNSGSSQWSNRAQVIEQQMEKLLGIDYIDIQIEGKPPTNFISEVRRKGRYSILECNWGPDYGDPETYVFPFYPGASYNFPEFAEGYTDAFGEKTYTNLVNKAREEVEDIKRRYELFAEAEGFLIEKAFIIPFGVGGGGYSASRLNPFESPYSPFGVSGGRFKGQRIMEKPMNTEEFQKAKETWEKERKEALRK